MSSVWSGLRMRTTTKCACGPVPPWHDGVRIKSVKEMNDSEERSLNLLCNVHIGLSDPGSHDHDARAVVKGDFQYWHYGCDGFDDRGWGCGYRTLQTLCSWIKFQFQSTHRCDTSTPCYTGSAHSGEDDSARDNGNALLNEDTDYGISVITSVEDAVSPSIAKQEEFPSDSDVNVIKVYNEVSENANCALCKASVSEVPSIPEVQEALVKMGDKPSTFYGSRQWIGSYEICLCIDYFYKVPCKILHLPKGSDLKEHLSLLKDHFHTQGSPVMMGGETDNASKGILGVSIKPAALLVLDPHFSGFVCDATTLQAAGFVTWVPVEDFHTNSFYNLCIPQLSALKETCRKNTH